MKKEKSKKNSKYGLLKVVSIAFILFAVLTWIIPAGIFNGATYTTSENGTMPVGLFGLFINPMYSFGIFAQYFLVFIAIGGLYGVLNKTGVYSKLVDGIAKKVEKHKVLSLVVISTLFSLLSAVIGNQIVLFVIVPFVIAVLLNAGYNKVTSVAATVGAILVGVAGSIFGTDVILVSFFNATKFSGIAYKLIFFVVITVLYNLFLLYSNGAFKKKNKDNIESLKETNIPLYEKNENSKSKVPMIIIFVIMILLVFVGCMNWDYNFGVTYFTELNTKITNIEWLPKVFGNLPVIGYFGNYEVAAIIVVFTFIIKWLYSIKFDEFVDGFKDGAKKMLKPALYAILASMIFAFMVNNNYNISTTISNWILGINEKFYVLTISLLGFVGGFFFNDLPYLVNSVYSAVGAYGTINITVMGILIQSGYALAMLCFPVSVILVSTLSYLNVSYKEWMKYIYKFLLAMFVLIIVFGLIALAI